MQLNRVNQCKNIVTVDKHTGTYEEGTKQDAQDEVVKTRLKWFNGPKGFGFVVPEGETIDAFLHITSLQRANISELGEGASLLCSIERGTKGAHVKEVLELLDIGIQPEPLKSPEDHTMFDGQPIQTMRGVVKWYKPDKGFGFIVPEDGKKDVFVHKSCLDDLGLETLETNAPVSMEVKTVSKGREVIKLELLDKTSELRLV